MAVSVKPRLIQARNLPRSDHGTNALVSRRGGLKQALGPWCRLTCTALWTAPAASWESVSALTDRGDVERPQLASAVWKEVDVSSSASVGLSSRAVGVMPGVISAENIGIVRDAALDVAVDEAPDSWRICSNSDLLVWLVGPSEPAGVVLPEEMAFIGVPSEPADGELLLALL